MKKYITKQNIFLLLSIGCVMFIFVFLVTCSWIGFGVKSQCQIAKQQYEGDCVEALIHYVDDESNPHKERSSAVWALGQLGDARALPVLEKYYEGSAESCKHNEGELCQYELSKAINLARGGINISAFVWRWNIE